MKPLRTFRLEEYLGEWEFKARHHLTASDAQSMTVEELLALGTDAESEAARDGLMRLSLAYIETWGMPELREAVAGTYERVDADHVWRSPAPKKASSGRCRSWSAPGITRSSPFRATRLWRR